MNTPETPALKPPTIIELAQFLKTSCAMIRTISEGVGGGVAMDRYSF